MVNPSLVKTDAGQRELRERTHGLSRPARTLLVLADGQRSGPELLAMVQGAAAGDLEALVQAGLLASRTGTAPRLPEPPAERAPEPAAAVAAEAVVAEAPAGTLGYQDLYDSLTALVKEQLGLLRGYKFALDIEKASGRDELLAVAERFAAEVSQRKGDAASRMVRRALGLA